MILDNLGFAELPPRARARLPADRRQLAAVRGRSRRSSRSSIAYPIAYWISRYGGRRKMLLLVLVMLPFWTSWVIRTYAWMIILRDNGVVNGILEGLGLIERADRPPQHRPRRRAGDDLRLPAVRDPAALRLDRPPGPGARGGRPRPLRQRAGGLLARDPAPHDAGHHRRGPAHVHPGDRRLRDARPARRRPDDHDRQGRSRRSSCRARTGPSGPPSASCSSWPRSSASWGPCGSCAAR